MEFDRQEALEEIKAKLGIAEREDDEFTAKEIAECFNISPVGLLQYFEVNEIAYERRKAFASGRRVYVYRFML